MKKILIIFLAFTSLYGFAQKSGKYSINNLEINTEYSDFGTAYYKNKQVVFSSPKKKTLLSYIIKSEWKPNKQEFLDLYSADMDIDGELINKTKLNKDVNSKWHEADVTFTSDFSTVYFTRDNYYASNLEKDTTGMTNLALFKATINEDGTWTDVVPLPLNNKNYSVGHPALSGDDSKLYFVSDMPGSVGMTDIYVVDVLGDNTYSSPRNLNSINTKGREMFPFISKDDVLYFSSDGRNGLGNLDIYASKLDKGTFTEPIHLASPLNSDADDFAFIINPEKKTGYFSSNRSGGKGDDDIYAFVEDEPIEFECNQSIITRVIDTKTSKPLTGAKLYVFHNGEMTDEVTLDESATYKMDVDCKEQYSFKVKMEGYTPNEKELTTSERPEYTNKIEIGLTPIPEPVVEIPRIILEPVYFDFDKYHIRKSIDADEELDKIIAIMKQYPEMIISIESFTDSRGDAAYNKLLSLNRAKATKEYMVKKGIDSNRIVGVKGMGESNLVNQCDGTVKCTEAEHQLNRRTEFVIVNPESYQKK
jgi:outer membrane protein OmpA-like peptidoglycan-associated protein